MLIYTLLNVALAASNDGGVQMALYNPGVDFARELIEGQSFDIEEPRIEREFACYDAIAIENVNVHIPIQTVDMRFDEGMLVVDIFFDTIVGQDMLILAEDENWTDWCIAFQTELRYARILDGRVSMALQAWVEDGEIQMEVVNTPIVTGDIETDIAWVPDELILTFVEDSIFNAVAERAEAEIPNLVSEYLDTTLFSSQIGPLGIDVELVDIDILRHALTVGMDVDVAWTGGGCDTPSIGGPEGRNPELDLADSHGAALGLGLTELQVNKVFHSAWSGGLLCFEQGPLAGLLNAIGDGFGEGIDDAELMIDFGAPPVFLLDEDRIRLGLDDFAVSFTGEVDGEEITFANVYADIDAAAEIRVDQGVSSFVLDLISVQLNVHTLEADPFLTDQEGAQDRLVTFLEEWAMETLSERIGTVVLYGNTFYTNDIYIRADEVRSNNGGLLMRASLFHSDDPAVDTEPPETEARVVDSSEDVLVVAWQGTDNQPDTLAFSWRINNESWSQWTAESQGEIPKPEPGEHVIQVRARDAWMNTDPTPALVAFSVSPENSQDKQQQGCMCSATSATGSQLAWLGLLPLLWSGRRRP